MNATDSGLWTSGPQLASEPRVIVEPTVEPVTLAEAKVHLRIDHTAEDAAITGWIVAARRLAEAYTNRAIMPQSLRVFWTGFPFVKYLGPESRALRLPGGTVSAVNSLAYLDNAGAWQTLVAGTDYAIQTDFVPARIYPQPGLAWPVVRFSSLGTVRAEYVAGFATAPADLKAAILLTVGYWHNNRGDAKDVANGDGLPAATKRILDYFRLPEYR